MNMLEIMNSMPGHPVTVRKVFTVESTNELVGEIHDDTTGFGISELVAANRTFLSYGKADMIVDLWEKSGERNDAITSMVYAMRHIDVGLSMCNISEVEDGIVRLRELLKGNHLNDAIGPYSRMFHLVAEGVVRDYGPLLEDDEISFLELVKWAYRHHFYQQTLTLIESRAPVNLINTGIFYYCDDENEKAQVTKVLVMQVILLQMVLVIVLQRLKLKNLIRKIILPGVQVVVIRPQQTVFREMLLLLWQMNILQVYLITILIMLKEKSAMSFQMVFILALMQVLIFIIVMPTENLLVFQQ